MYENGMHIDKPPVPNVLRYPAQEQGGGEYIQRAPLIRRRV